MNFISRNELVFVVPLHASDGGEKIVPHHLPDLFNAGAFFLEDSAIPLLPNAPDDHTR